MERKLNLELLYFLHFLTDVNPLLSFGGPQLYNSEALPFTYGQLADKLYNSVCLSHRSQAGTERGLGALQCSLWLDVCSKCLAI